ncbi:hypothetical protein CNMCM8980_008611 [Aspergillus fumigatiaffinis]|jgi:hypothetical protein|uniref:Uncharacterized protein n=1 Tax=Aspergillus fumigatiaffinis TaxID=340414 RepID=A0A8H4M9M6_9EURO|nr:hypothetical protein CNMCM5878_008154 [Aspergillus fumigatiaffinis]KAF4221762.1 hypothetical protein CNMCM5878_008186 [Aspergillus fumigatiaffinis]KAF4234659.1 hypothetical protein CNMCM6805_008502 [Aspergillus fumigatiaffinis]KAF4246410.1 hypothetical protein CNMCM8980_008611 [Aspergillus fumigatiaffinis]
MTSKKWKEEWWSTSDDRADEHNTIEYGWSEDWGYWIQVMDDRLKMADDWHSPYNTLAELDRFRASVLDGGREGCYLSAYTGPRGRGKRVDFEVMMDLWDIYQVANTRILSEFRNLSEREIQEVSETVEAKNDDEWVNPWAKKCVCGDCEAFDALVATNDTNDEGDESDESDENDKDEDEDD